MNAPQLADFGLSEHIVSDSQARVARSERLFERLITAWFSLIGIGIVVYAIFCGVRGGFYNALAGAFIVGVISLFVLGAVGSLIGGILFMVLRRLCSPSYRRARDVVARFDTFQRACQQFAADLLRHRRDFWESLDGLQFEHELAALYRRAGYSAFVTRATGDDGIDIWLDHGIQRTIVQCKRYSGAVGPAVIREIFGVLQHVSADRAIVATTGYFTDAAKKFAAGKPIELVTLDEILALQDTTTEAPNHALRTAPRVTMAAISSLVPPRPNHLLM